jgi:hypothetical protein
VGLFFEAKGNRYAFMPWRVLVAGGLFLVLASGALTAEIYDLGDAAAALWGFAGTVFGIVAAFLGAESRFFGTEINPEP